MMKMEHDMKIIDGHVHLVQYIAGTGAGGELRFAGNGMAEYASGERFRMLPDEFSQGVVTARTFSGRWMETEWRKQCCSREITLVSRISIPWKQ